MGYSGDIDRLIDAVRSLEDRVRELERRLDDDGDGGVDIIGFDVNESDDFDEDDSEYRRQVQDRRVPRPQPEQGYGGDAGPAIEAVWRTPSS